MLCLRDFTWCNICHTKSTIHWTYLQHYPMFFIMMQISSKIVTLSMKLRNVTNLPGNKQWHPRHGHPPGNSSGQMVKKKSEKSWARNIKECCIFTLVSGVGRKRYQALITDASIMTPHDQRTNLRYEMSQWFNTLKYRLYRMWIWKTTCLPVINPKDAMLDRKLAYSFTLSNSPAPAHHGWWECSIR